MHWFRRCYFGLLGKRKPLGKNWGGKAAGALHPWKVLSAPVILPSRFGGMRLRLFHPTMLYMAGSRDINQARRNTCLSILQHPSFPRPGLAEIPHLCKPKITNKLNKNFARPVDNSALQG
jgi:hypothetical protein